MSTTTSTAGERRARRVPWAFWLPGLLVAVGAGVATAHGLYEVALASSVPPGIAWLYPLITDGLALVAYVSTVRLYGGSGRAYAWAVVVLSAGLSGVAQASYLADGVGSAPPALRFGVGAWPAIAAAIVAHLLFLLVSHRHDVQPSEASVPETGPPTAKRVQPASLDAAVHPGVQPSTEQPRALPASTPDTAPVPEPVQPPAVTGKASARVSPARERARTAARRHASLHGCLPTVSQLMSLADVSRGSAGNALKELREQPTQLHVVNETPDIRSDQ